MKTLALLAALSALPLSASAQVVKMVRFAKIGPLGGGGFEPAGTMRERGSGWCEHGNFIDADLLPERREVRVLCKPYDAGEGSRVEVQVLDADARTVATKVLVSTNTGDLVFPSTIWLERGKAEPLLATWNHFQARVWNEKGQPVDLPTKDGIGGLAGFSAKDGGPLVVVARPYGEKGLEAFRPDGRRAWAIADLIEVRGLEPARLDGRAVAAAWHSIGRIAFVDASGKIRERALPGGNSDRLMLDDGKEPRLYALDSGAGSKRETLGIWTAVKDKDGRRWEKTGVADLGPVTITGWTLARFTAGSPSRVVVGTSNGWVFILDGSGAPVATRKFRSPVKKLSASDLDGDGRDELVVVIDGASENAVIFSPLTIP